MFERFSERARRTVFFARLEASGMGATWFETEHLLLGLARENLDLLNQFLTVAATEESLRAEIVAVAPLRRTRPASADLPLTAESKRVLAFALEEAERLARKTIEPQHLLLGLLREEGSIAARMLRERGADLEGIRRRLGGTASGPSTGSGVAG